MLTVNIYVSLSCYGPGRSGDIKHSFASIDKAKDTIGYAPLINFGEGLKKLLKGPQVNSLPT